MARSEGLLTKEIEDAIDLYGPRIRRAIGGSFAQARPCLVIEGQLTTDPLADDSCELSAFRRDLTAVKHVLLDTASQMAADRPDVAKDLRRASFGTGQVLGYLSKNENYKYEANDDVDLLSFDERMRQLQFYADQVVSLGARPITPAPAPQPVQPQPGVPLGGGAPRGDPANFGIAADVEQCEAQPELPWC